MLAALRKLSGAAPARVHDFMIRHPVPRKVEPALIRIYPCLAGSVFRRTRRLNATTQWWTRKQFEELQVEQLRGILSHAYSATSYYRQVMDEAGFRPQAFASLADMAKVPMTSKEALRLHQTEMTDRTADRGRLVAHESSGSTSSGLRLYESPEAWAFENAFFDRWYAWHGIRIGERTVVFSAAPGRRVLTYNPMGNIMYLNLAQVRVDAAAMVSLLRSFRPAVLRGYPSAIVQAAEYILREGWSGSIPTLKRVFLASEQVFTSQVSLIREAFGVPVSSHYGLSERVALIQQCPSGSLFHIMPEYSYVEILGEDGNPVTQGGEIGLIVGTSFCNRAVPLIRYQTADWAVVADDQKCPDCGRSFKSVCRIEGRSGDFVRTPSGKVWSPTAIEWVNNVQRPTIRESQIWQTDVDQIVILIVPGEGFKDEDGQAYVDDLQAMIGEPGLKMSASVVDQIDRPKSQKQRFVRSDIVASPFDAPT